MPRLKNWSLALPKSSLRLRSCRNSLPELSHVLAESSVEKEGAFFEFEQLAHCFDFEVFETEPVRNKMAEEQVLVVDALRRMQFLQIAQSSISKFNGENGKPIFKFFEEFDSLADAGGLDDGVKLSALPLCLTSYPRSVFTSFAANERDTYTSAKRNLINYFQPPAVREKAILEFQQRMQRENEAVDLYAHKLLSLGRQAYPNLIQNDAEIKQIVKVQFLKGLLPKFHNLIAICGTPETLDKALKIAKRIESPFQPEAWGAPILGLRNEPLCLQLGIKKY